MNRTGQPPGTTAARLSDLDRRTIFEAREVAEIGSRDLCEWTGETDHHMAYAVALGRAQWRIGELLRLVERLAADTTPEAAK